MKAVLSYAKFFLRLGSLKQKVEMLNVLGKVIVKKKKNLKTIDDMQ